MKKSAFDRSISWFETSRRVGWASRLQLVQSKEGGIAVLSSSGDRTFFSKALTASPRSLVLLSFGCVISQERIRGERIK